MGKQKHSCYFWGKEWLSPRISFHEVPYVQFSEVVFTETTVQMIGSQLRQKPGHVWLLWQLWLFSRNPFLFRISIVVRVLPFKSRWKWMTSSKVSMIWDFWLTSLPCSLHWERSRGGYAMVDLLRTSRDFPMTPKELPYIQPQESQYSTCYSPAMHWVSNTEKSLHHIHTSPSPYIRGGHALSPFPLSLLWPQWWRKKLKQKISWQCLCCHGTKNQA